MDGSTTSSSHNTTCMEQRLFIAINIPKNNKAEIRNALRLDNTRSAELYANARVIPEENWHITLKFLGNQPKKYMGTIEQVITSIAARTIAPEMTIRMLTTAPPRRPPRMIWATTTSATNKALGSIKEAIEVELEKRGIIQKEEAHPTYHGHINLARLPEGRRIADHVVSLPNELTFKPATIDLMESDVDRRGAKYSIVRSLPFKFKA